MPDINYQSYSGVSDLYINGEIVSPMTPIKYDDVLKVSASHRLMFENVTVNALGARENALDVNNLCTDISFHSCRFLGGNQAAVVLKGGSNVLLNRCTLRSGFSAESDILVDDYSDQSKAPSRVVIKDCVSASGAPILYAFGRYKKPVFINTEHRLCLFRTIGMHLYNHGKDLCTWLFNVKRRR